MADGDCQPVAVSRRICAPAHDIFQVLADPVRHPEFDGSKMVRGAGSTAVISGVGDVFVMKMYYSEIGDYEMNNHVVEYEDMAKALERLDALCARQGNRPSPP